MGIQHIKQIQGEVRGHTHMYPSAHASRTQSTRMPAHVVAYKTGQAVRAAEKSGKEMSKDKEIIGTRIFKYTD